MTFIFQDGSMIRLEDGEMSEQAFEECAQANADQYRQTIN